MNLNYLSEDPVFRWEFVLHHRTLRATQFGPWQSSCYFMIDTTTSLGCTILELSSHSTLSAPKGVEQQQQQQQHHSLGAYDRPDTPLITLCEFMPLILTEGFQGFQENQ